MSLFPFVPNVPGVPALARSALDSIGVPDFLSRDLISFVFGSGLTQWGIFSNGQPVVLCDNVLSIDFRKENNISDYQVEEGAFESYNKVEMPFDARIRFSAGGSNDRLADFLQSIVEIVDSLELFDVVTPQRVYESANVVSYNYRRSASNGVGLLTVDVHVVEVRVTAESEFSNTKQPGGAGQTNGGVVQPSTVDPGSSLANSAEGVQ